MAFRSPIMARVKLNQQEYNRIIGKYNKIIAESPKEMFKSAQELSRDIKKEAQSIITEETDGTGKLSEGMRIRSEKLSEERSDHYIEFVDEVADYAKAVHEGFKAHFVHRDQIKDWLALHPEVRLREGRWLEVGKGKKTDRVDDSPRETAPWLNANGVRFFDRAFRNIVPFAEESFFNEIRKLYKT